MGGIEAGRHTLQVVERKYACGFLCIARTPVRTHAHSCRISTQSTRVSPRQIHHRASPASICVRVVMLRACAHMCRRSSRARATTRPPPRARTPPLPPPLPRKSPASSSSSAPSTQVHSIQVEDWRGRKMPWTSALDTVHQAWMTCRRVGGVGGGTSGRRAVCGGGRRVKRA